MVVSILSNTNFDSARAAARIHEICCDFYLKQKSADQNWYHLLEIIRLYRSNGTMSIACLNFHWFRKKLDVVRVCHN